jgi:hypothetical protein
MPSATLNADLEKVPPNEPARIDHVAALTVKQLDNRYTGKPRVLRGVHPKDHGCVEASFTVSPTLAPEYRVGVFSKPGRQYRAAIRFSNAAPLVTPDSLDPPGADGKPVRAHGSRGMAIKLYGVEGSRLVPNDGERTHDFLMINQPAFAFANVEDYEALSEFIAQDDKKAALFFATRVGPTNPLTGAANPPDVIARAQVSGGIVQRIKSLTFPKIAFQPPPLSPFDNRYFSAAPFSFGQGRVMKFSARPVNPMTGELGDSIDRPDYLREALRKRMAEAGGKDICFDFQVQVRDAKSLAGQIETDMENMCTVWDEAKYPFVTVARIAIPPQDVASPERQEFCETLFYTPWHGLDDHRPLGGINRMRLKVYEASAQRRGCPVSPDLPPAKKAGPPPPPPPPRPPASRDPGSRIREQ